jgi:type I pantothenate kinase
VKSGRPEVAAPVYSHLTYDIVPGETITIRRPDLIIVEGINVLQTQRRDQRTRDLPEVYVSDFFDFSIYVDADEQDISRWYVERFRMLRNTAFQRPESYFHRYASLTDEEADQVALGIWREINEVNLRENIKPTRSRARLILEKGPDHAVRRIMLRKL